MRCCVRRYWRARSCATVIATVLPRRDELQRRDDRLDLGAPSRVERPRTDPHDAVREEGRPERPVERGRRTGVQRVLLEDRELGRTSGQLDRPAFDDLAAVMCKTA